MKRAAMIVGVLAVVSITAVAQENRSEISVQGTGFFTKDTDRNGVRQHATDTGGFLVGYRHNFNRWLAAEANYGYDRNTQTYFGGMGARVESSINQITGAAVVKLPSFARLQPYALAGGGALVFDPTGNAGGNFAGATTQTKGAFVYGAGADYAFTRQISLRVEYRAMSTKHQISISRASIPTAGRTLRNRQPASSSAFNKPRPKCGTGVQPNTRATCSKE